MSDIPLLEWLSAHDLRVNLLVEGRQETVGRIAQDLKQWCPKPSMITVLPGALTPPSPRITTWFLQGVCGLTDQQQQQLDEWLDRDGSDVQVVSIAKRPLWPLVEAGRFLERLYYRLNTILLDATGRQETRSTYDEGPGAP